MTEVIVLDATAIAPDRAQLDITSWVSQAGPNYGDAAITAYMADQAVGSTQVDYRIPNRTITIPLNLRAVGGVSFSTIRSQIQAKAALFQRAGGQIMRQVDGTALYADVVSATLHLGGSIFQAYHGFDTDAVLTLECIPEWYGDEVTLDSATATGVYDSVLKQSSSTAVIAGDYPARTRIVVTDTSGNAQNALLWGIRSRHYDSASTAALFYEAEAMTPINGATAGVRSGASGGYAVNISNAPPRVWTAMLATTLTSGSAQLTHQGSYRVWARCFAAADSPQFRLTWGVGSLSVPNVNDAVLIPNSSSFYLLDLGTINLDPQLVGGSQWVGVIQVKPQIDFTVEYIDCVYFQPLDDGAGRLAYTSVPSSASIEATQLPTAASTSNAVGTIAWTNAGNVKARDAAYATAVLPSGTQTNWLIATGFGFSIPTAATIVGIQAQIYLFYTGTPGFTVTTYPRLVKAGAIQSGAFTQQTGTGSYASGWIGYYGAATDLWGGTWTPADINNANFGFAQTFTNASSPSNVTAYVEFMQMSVWYTLASGFTVGQDAVVYASHAAELRFDGMCRTPDGTIYGPVSQVTGDLPRLPPSGIENQPVELLVKPTRGDLAAAADSALDAFSVQVKYRPSYLYTP